MRLWAALAALAVTVPFALAQPATAGQTVIKDIRTWAGPERTRVVFDLTEPTDHSLFTLSNPQRVVIDFKSAAMNPRLTDAVPEEGVLARIRSAPRDRRDLRVVFDTRTDVEPKSFLVQPNEKYGHRLVVDLEPKQADRDGPVKTAPESRRELVIAIDAGHGGEDPGAIGKRGTYEKDVVLAVARKLANLIEKEPGMRPLLIRGKDYYLGLRERTRKAREGGADIFVSIHADAIENRTVRGSSVYTLSRQGASTEVARLLAERENSADRIGGVSLEDKDDVVASVLVDLSRAATVESSNALASTILSQLNTVGAVHKHSVEHAGFVVLKSLDMPSVLVELAFISNPTEEQRLRSGDYQWALARSLRDGLRGYVREHMPPGVRVAQGREHVVRRGETLSGIARQYSVSLRRLRDVNDIRGDQLIAGSTLLIP
ncbi:N-acetylmuramoyl-L-alanine amidase [Ectothiorhodospiraceae bacterium WFHF3C12]|nr:N-acetylmuramoyl-L-alanine amidase [Ectothiorhodospiraceae bacterium WFHF3C12]